MYFAGIAEHKGHKTELPNAIYFTKLLIFSTVSFKFISTRDSLKVRRHILLMCHLLNVFKYGPREANLVLIAYASSESSGEPAHRCSLIRAVNQEEPSDRKPDPWPSWMARHAQLKFVMTECSRTQIRLTGPILFHFQKVVLPFSH